MLSHCSATLFPRFRPVFAMVHPASKLHSLRNAFAMFSQGICQGVPILELLAQRESSIVQAHGKAKWHHPKGQIDVKKG
jgi:hypothetical protein